MLPLANQTLMATTATTLILGNRTSELLFTPLMASASSSTAAPVLPFELNLQNIVLCVFLLIMLCLTIGGNIFVILAICADSHLRSPTHFLMGSLAVADLLLGTTVLPFSAVKLLMNEKWPFGEIFCDIWLATDVLCCTASIYLVLVISIDRYIGVKRPLAYPLIVTKKRIYIVIALVWILSLIVSLAPQIGLKSPQRNTNECEVNQNQAYALASALISFYIPLLVILIIYYQIFLAARNQMRFLQTGTKTSKTGTKTDETIVTLRVHIGPTKKLSNLEVNNSARPVCQRCANRESNGAANFHRDARKENSYAGYVRHDSSPMTSPRNAPKSRSIKLNSTSSSTVMSNTTSTTPETQKPARKFSSSLVLKGDDLPSKRLICPQCSNRMSVRSLQLNLTRSSSSISRSQTNNGGGPLASPNSVNNPITSKLAKFKREQKAAKTLAIVVG